MNWEKFLTPFAGLINDGGFSKEHTYFNSLEREKLSINAVKFIESLWTRNDP